GAHAFVQSPQKLRIAPAADAGLRIRGDVRAVKRHERRRERPPAGIAPPTMRAIGVTCRTVGGVREIGTAHNHIRLGGAGRRRQQHDGGEDPYCSFARNVSWHALQTLRSLNAASTLGLSPLLIAASSAATWSPTF